MKKKFWIRFLIFIGGILGIYHFILFPTGWLVIYHKNQATANEPGLPLNSRMISTNLKESKILDFVVFRHKDSTLGRGQRVFRLMARERDTIEIRNGIVYRNNVNLDSNLELKHNYFTSIVIRF